jgi:peptidyl-tRNA hydrolase
MEMLALYELTNNYSNLDSCVYRDYHVSPVQEMMAQFKKIQLGINEDLSTSKDLIKNLLTKFTAKEKIEYGNLLLKFLESSSSFHAKEMQSFIFDIIFNSDEEE